MNEKILIKVEGRSEADYIQQSIMDNSAWNDIGIISYNLPLISTLSAVENIMLPINYHKRINRAGAEALTSELLEKFGILHIAHLRGKDLNEHQLLIVKFLRAIISYPDVVVFILPHDMMSVEVYEIFITFVDSITNFDIVIVEHESFLPMYYKETNYTEITYEQWATHVLKI